MKYLKKYEGKINDEVNKIINTIKDILQKTNYDFKLSRMKGKEKWITITNKKQNSIVISSKYNIIKIEFFYSILHNKNGKKDLIIKIFELLFKNYTKAEDLGLWASPLYINKNHVDDVIKTMNNEININDLKSTLIFLTNIEKYNL